MKNRNASKGIAVFSFRLQVDKLDRSSIHLANHRIQPHFFDQAY